jgi:YggT family protein
VCDIANVALSQLSYGLTGPGRGKADNVGGRGFLSSAARTPCAHPPSPLGFRRRRIPKQQRSTPMQSFLSLVDIILNFYVWLLVIWVILGWLVSFDVVNTRNRFVYLVSDFLFRITEPVLRPIRRVVPNISGIDISPIILILGIWFIRSLMREYLWS